MKKQSSLIISVGLIVAGVLFLGANLAGMLFGFRLWQLWPLIIVAVGWGLVLPPLLVRGRRGLGGMFIAGMPVLTTGAILLFASIFRGWHVWRWLWPWEVLGVALGFALAALWMHVPWLLFPAIVIGANGLLFQFCAITGWWQVWSVLWPIELLAVGIALLVINPTKATSGRRKAGIMLCWLAMLGFGLSFLSALLSAFIPAWWLWRWVSAIGLILAGVGVLLFGGSCASPAAVRE
ncbi:MAG TPA: hypothetical protein PKH77_10240 [Anaerolineae bacterium]|nr:hypothetical protein [Anaerolineae bacterium]